MTLQDTDQCDQVERFDAVTQTDDVTPIDDVTYMDDVARIDEDICSDVNDTNDTYQPPTTNHDELAGLSNINHSTTITYCWTSSSNMTCAGT